MNAPPSLAQENLTQLHVYFGDVAKALLDYLQTQRRRGATSAFQTVSTLSQVPTLIKRVNNQSLFLHDRNRPADEARESAEDILKNPPGLTVVYSAGLGYLPCALAPLLAQNRLIVIEPEYDILFLALQTCDWRGLLPSPNLLLLAGLDAVAEGQRVLARCASQMEEGFLVVSGRRLMDEERSLLDAMRGDCASSFERYLALRENPAPPAASCVGIAVSESHRDLQAPFAEETRGVGFDPRSIFRRKPETRFLGNAARVWETVGLPLPKTMLALSPFVFSNREWDEMGKRGVRRIVWFFDDPFRFEIEEDRLRQIDELYCFDPFLAERLQSRLARPVRYTPAATSIPNVGESAPPEDLPASLSVSFVGSTGLQRFDNRFLQWTIENPPALQTLRESVRSRLQRGTPFSYDEILSLPLPVSGLSHPNRVSLTEDLATFWTRCEYLSALPEGAAIYGDEGWAMAPLTGSIKRFFAGKSLDFSRESPWVYRRSNININIFNVQCVNSPTLRLFDVMACGGFLLTEHRPFVETLFRIGEELDTFRTPAELREKVDYYLAHPDRRRQIARAGQERVWREHRFRNRFHSIFTLPNERRDLKNDGNL